MRIIQLKCPSCGSSLQVEDGLETFFCQYCGQRIILADQSEHVVKAKVASKMMDHETEMYRMKIEEDRMIREEKRKEQKENDRKIMIGLLIWFAIAIGMYTIGKLLGI